MLRIIVFTVLTSPVLLAQPLPRHLEEVTWDNAKNKLILFGGVEIVSNQDPKEPSHVSEWDGGRWEEKNVQGPRGRRGHALVYDESNKLIIVMGGISTTAQKKDTMLYDVWSWKADKWTLINNQCPVKSPEAVSDPDEKSIFVYGDVSDKSKEVFGDEKKYELWAFKNNRWKKLSADGPMLNGPNPISFNTKDHSLNIPTWESGKSIVWKWKNAKWEKVSATNEFPEERSRYALIYHKKENVTYLFGGRTPSKTFLNDFWKWDGTRWSRMSTRSTPEKRASTNFAYFNDIILLYGGTVQHPDGKTIISNEIWFFENGDWIKAEN
jgi:hypothetical protein